jgi:hypothetical protein
MASAPADPFPSPPPSRQSASLREKVMAELRANKAFLIVTIAGCVLLLSVAVTMATVAYQTRRILTAGGAAMLLFTIGVYAAGVALSMYTNYCVVHGKCALLALFQAVGAVVVASVSLMMTVFLPLTGRGGTGNGAGTPSRSSFVAK